MSRFCFNTVSLIILFLFCLSYSRADDRSLANPYVKTYPFESAVVHYTVKTEYGHGKTTEGTNILYIKGDKTAKVLKGPIHTRGKVENVETLQIITTEYVYTVDLIEKTGTKVDNPKKYTKLAYDSLSDEEKKAFHERMERRGIMSLDLLGMGEKVGTEVILDHKCDVYQSGDPEKLGELGEDVFMKSWVWKEAEIPLKIITEGVGGSSKIIATKIEENVKIPDSRFIVPSDIKVTYDEAVSEFAKKRYLSRFHVLKTGESMPLRVKPKKRIITPGEASKESKADKKSQEKEEESQKTNKGESGTTHIH